jgi:hypothetical protein
MQFRPTGPLFADQPGLKPSKTNPNAMIDRDGTAMPVLAEGPPPPAPAYLVSPNEISATNHEDVARRLADEIEQDRRATEQFPNYATVSKVERKR